MSAEVERGLKRIGVTVSKPTLAVITIIFGALVLVFKDFLQLIVGIYLIIQGTLLLLDYFEIRIEVKRKSIKRK
jgi:cytochrome c biogenesis protein CcdA